MKKNNLFFNLIFAFLVCFCFGSTAKPQTAFADGETIEITFNANGGVCETETATTNSEGKLDNLPTATKNGFVFAGWSMTTGMVDSETIYTENTTLYATWEQKISQYTISYDSGKFVVTGKTTNSTINYTVSDDKTSLSESIADLLNDLTDKTTLVTINFKNITATENIDFSLSNLKLTGTLNLTEYHINYISPENLSNLTLSDLTINSTTSPNQIEISGDKSVKITINNCAFNSDETQDTYAILFNKKNHSIVVNGEISHTSNFFYNYENGITATFKSFALTNQTSGKLAITVPYDADGKLILTTENNLASQFDLISLSSIYSCEPNLMFGGSMYAMVEFNINFNANGGNLSSELATIKSRFNGTKTDFPTDENITKTHSTLEGYAGKIILDADTMNDLGLSNSIWYFGKTELENFITNGSDLSKIADYFLTELPEKNGFTYYLYSETKEDLNYQAVNLMLQLNQTPEFVALWSESQFHISFETNGGNSINDIVGLFGSDVTLPTPTKNGFDFIGWFLDSSLETSANITTMPDTNPTLYAKWQAHSHILSIYLNNGTAKIDKSVDFGTTLLEIDGVNPEQISKVGHTFVGWFTNEALTQELTQTTMPDEDFSIYAKWQINSYTISLYLNHKTNNSLFNEITAEFDSDISAFVAQKPVFEGYTFNGWFTDEFGEFPYTLTNRMPAQNLTLYAFWTPTEYRLTFYYQSSVISTKHDMHFGDTITLPASPTISELVFENWYLDSNFTELFTLTTMPSRNLNVYAKMVDKQIISIDDSTQTYTISKNKGFTLNSRLSNFKVEYLVDGTWTITTPTKRGTYDVRITRNEDSVYKSVSKIIKGGLVITANDLDLSIVNLILYCLAGVELICAIILLFLRKQRKTYLTYAVTLPFGVISNSQFINFIVALILAVFGFVLVIIQLTKLRKLNNDIANISDDNKEYKPVDVSENDSISKKVDILLKDEGFVSENDEQERDNYENFDDFDNLENINLDDEKENQSNDSNNFDDEK